MSEMDETHQTPSSIDSPTPTTISFDEEIKKTDSSIYIDPEGVHDFDFKRRPAKGGKKLKKFGRRSLNSISMADLNKVERHSSTGSETSIRKRFSSILHPSQNQDALENGSVSSESPQKDWPADPLPDTRKDLEIRLNYHLAELDLLRKTIRSHNDVIKNYVDRHQMFQTRSTSDMKESVRRQAALIKQARDNRNSYKLFVDYHNRELNRIKEKRIEIELAAGHEPTLPQVYKNLWTDDDWAILFSP